MVKLIFQLIFLVNREASFVESRTNSKDLSLKPNRPLYEISYLYFYQKFDSLDGCGNADLSKICVLEKKTVDYRYFLKGKTNEDGRAHSDQIEQKPSCAKMNAKCVKIIQLYSQSVL